MKKFIIQFFSYAFILFLVPSGVKATDYYVDPTSAAGTANGSFATPWKTLAAVQSAKNSIVAGDRILFKRGTKIFGTLTWDNLYSTAPSGNSIAPITFGAYGSGAKPIIEYPGTSQSKYNTCFTFRVVNYITIQELNFTDDVVLDINDRVSTAHMAIGIQLGDYPSGKNYYNKVLNCDFSNIGHGVVIVGDKNLVQDCSMTDLKNIVSTSTPTTEDYGSVGVTITGSENDVIHCYMRGLWSESLDFGYNGGAIEMYHAGHGDRNRALYNTFIDCNGVAEFGADPSTASTAVDNLFAGNLIINCGALSYVNQNPSFSIQCSNIQYINNDIVEQNKISRFSGDSSGAGIVSPAAKAKWSSQQWLLEGGGGQTAPIVYNFKNNIVKMNTGMKPATTSTQNKMVHQNNMWNLTSPSSLSGFSLGTGEFSTSTTYWTDISNPDAQYWNFNLLAGSLPIDAGQNAGVQTLMNGPIIGLPDIGAYEYASTITPTPGPHTFIIVNQNFRKYILKLQQ